MRVCDLTDPHILCRAGLMAMNTNFSKIFFLLVLLLLSGTYARDITSVLNDGQGDFDPWNTTRWADWYSADKMQIIEKFEISTDVNFAVRTSDWQPDINGTLVGNTLFYVRYGQGIKIDGKDLVVDARTAAYRTKTLAELYESGTSSGTGFDYCFGFAQPLNASVNNPTVIQNFTLKGFVQSIRTFWTQTHPLTIQNCVFTRNQWGVYFSGQDTTVTSNQFLENSKGAMYSGSGSGKNFIIYNTYRDNCYDPFESYADIVMDTAYKTLIEGNRFIASEYAPEHFSGAVAFYRNLGEGGSLRENAPSFNIVRNNSINDRLIGINVGARMGRQENTNYDIAQEGRDYCYYNTIQSNDFNNVTIGIKLNTSGNTIASNTFTNVTKPIVLNCVFYSLTENTINGQNAADVSLWMTVSDYAPYEDWFTYQWKRNRGITESEKFVHIRTDYGSDDYIYTGTGDLVVSPTLMVDDDAVLADFTGSDKQINFRDYNELLNYWTEVNDYSVPVSDGLVLRLDMSDITTDGANKVTSWNDLSGNNNDAVQTSTVSRPILVNNITPTGGSAIKFDGINDYLNLPTNFNGGQWTIFAVYDLNAFDSGSGSRRIINFGYNDIDPGESITLNYTTYSVVAGSATTGVRALSRTTAGAFTGANSGVPSGYAVNNFYIAGMTNDYVSGTVASYLYNQAGYVCTASTTGANAFGSGNSIAAIGAGCGTTNPTPANFFNGWISEILVYNRVLTSDEMTQVSKYLRDKHINREDRLDTQNYKLNNFIDCDTADCSLDLYSFISYWLEDVPMNDTYSSGGMPIDIAVGDFYEALPGDEFAVIWDSPVSEISESSLISDTYYTIIIYDSNGIEINRCGRSTHKWKAIAAGDFLSDAGCEIAAVSEDADNGYYPISIFRRGYMTPHIVLMPTNTYKIRDITSGNFTASRDSYDEIALTYESSGPMQIDYVKPTDASWSATTAGIAGRPLQIAGGYFNKVSTDSVAMITENAVGGYYKIYFYLPGGTTAFYTAQTTNTTPFTAIAGGRFTKSLTVDQVAAAGAVVDGVCQIGYYSAYQNNAYRFAGQRIIGTAVKALDCGGLNIPAKLGYYEKAEGFTDEQADYGSVINGWGKQLAVLPQISRGQSIPVFWINNNSSHNQQKYIKVTPVVR
jgi:hypothetical protein